MLGPYTFSIGDTTGFSDYIRGGVVTQVKMPKSITFKSLAQSLQDPDMLITDWAKMERPAQMHIGYMALHEFAKRNGGRLPAPRNAEDANTVVAIATEINGTLAGSAKVEQIDGKLITKMAYQATGELTPMTSFIGGVAAQEVLKACSGKFHPVMQV